MGLLGSRLLCTFALVAAITAPAVSQQSEDQRIFSEIKGLNWKLGPSTGKVAGRASLAIPASHGFLAATATSKFLTLMKNLPQTDSYTIAPNDLSWFAVFSFDDTGYVKDDEKIDADAVLQALKDNNARGNEERRRRGFPTLSIEGWFVAPHYDVETKRLEWATRLRSEFGDVSVNYKIRLLGRAGVMSAVLVSDPDSLDTDIRAFKSVLNGFSFDPGERYAEFRAGDKVAEYGLTGLIIGGAAAAAAKTGIFKILGKFAIIILAGGAAAIGGIFKWLFRPRTTT